MKTKLVGYALLLASLAVAIPAQASVPAVINYQGRLTQPSGAPVADGTYSMLFSIYAAPTGGSALWSETQSAVGVKGGLFSATLGIVTSIPTSTFDNPTRYFAVKVGSDPEMTPRQQIGSVAYALVAGNGVPAGGVIVWSGAANAIPAGWALCDGTNGTPDLRNKFVVGAGAAYAVGAGGGVASNNLAHSHTVNAHTHSVPSHYHSVQMRLSDLWGAVGGDAAMQGTGLGGLYDYQAGTWGTVVNGGTYSGTVDSALGNGTTNSSLNWDQSTGTTSSAGNGDTGSASSSTTDSQLGVVDNRPPYYALCFIIKVGS